MAQEFIASTVLGQQRNSSIALAMGVTTSGTIIPILVTDDGSGRGKLRVVVG